MPQKHNNLNKYYYTALCLPCYKKDTYAFTNVLQNIITFVHCTAVVFLQSLKAHPYGNVSKLHVGLFWLDK